MGYVGNCGIVLLGKSALGEGILEREPQRRKVGKGKRKGRFRVS